MITLAGCRTPWFQWTRARAITIIKISLLDWLCNIIPMSVDSTFMISICVIKAWVTYIFGRRLYIIQRVYWEVKSVRHCIRGGSQTTHIARQIKWLPKEYMEKVELQAKELYDPVLNFQLATWFPCQPDHCEQLPRRRLLLQGICSVTWNGNNIFYEKTVVKKRTSEKTTFRLRLASNHAKMPPFMKIWMSWLQHPKYFCRLLVSAYSLRFATFPEFLIPFNVLNLITEPNLRQSCVLSVCVLLHTYWLVQSL